MAKRKPLEIDMCAGSQLMDTQGEMLSVEGADISELTKLNDNHGKGFFNSIGRVTSSKKIFKAEDCEDDRQRYYWNKIKAPYIYVKGVLYDDEDHPNARAAAAILRNIHKSDTPLQLKASVEGGVVSRGISNPSLLARTKIHSIALTFTPANNATLVEPIGLDKGAVDEEADMLLIKSVMHLAETNVPSFRHIVRDASATKVQENVEKLQELMKTLGIEGDIKIPTKEHIIKRSLEHKVINNMQEIKDLIKAAREQEEIQKGVKSAIAGAALTTALASPTAIDSTDVQDTKAPPAVTQQVNLKRMPAAHQKVYEEVSNKYPMLGSIGMIESSGGKNYEHAPITDSNSMHHGHTAGGMFGMMPHTAAFILKKDKELASKYPELVEAAQDIKANHRAFTDKFNSDPEAAADFAISMFQRNSKKTINPEMLAYSWLNGLKGAWNAYKNNGMEHIASHPYVQAIVDHHEKNKDLKKALTAGYGGAGTPTNRVGGGVMQSESLESNLKYIDCDQCGKDQVYAKYQVKCRSCGHNFSLEKLYGMIKGKGE